MADIFNFFVYDDRTIQFELAEPIMLEDTNVTQFKFRIPKSINGFDMTGWAWWFVYVNASRQKYSVPLVFTDDEDEPDEYANATYTVDYGMSGTAGTISFALEAINADATTSEILNEWHTKTYTTKVLTTLQGNETEFTPSEFDIISAKLEEIIEMIEGGGGGGGTSDNITNESSVSGSTVTDALNALSGEIANKGTYSKPSGGIPKTDLASAVQTSLEKADTALQTAPVTSVNGQTGAVTGLQTTANLVTSLSESSTDTQYPSAKAVYDAVSSGGGGESIDASHVRLASGTVPAGITSSAIGDGMVDTGLTLGDLKAYKYIYFKMRLDEDKPYFGFRIGNNQYQMLMSNATSLQFTWLDSAKTAILPMHFALGNNGISGAPLQPANRAYYVFGAGNASAIMGSLSIPTDDTSKIYLGLANMNGLSATTKDLIWGIYGMGAYQ